MNRPATDADPLIYDRNQVLNPSWEPELQRLARLLLNKLGKKLTDDNIARTVEFLSLDKVSLAFAKTAFDLGHSGVSARKKILKSLKKELSKVHIPTFDTVQESKVFDKALSNLGEINNSEQIADPVLQTDVEEISRRIMEFKLEKPQGASLHHLLDWIGNERNNLPFATTLLDFMKKDFQSFVVEHDWAKAFDGVKDFDGGEIRLPFEYSCFEFRVNGMRILMLLGYVENGAIEGFMATGINKHWYVNANVFTFVDGKIIHKNPCVGLSAGEVDAFEVWCEKLAAQIRAVCIMLDAGVAVAERHEQGHGLNKQRMRQGKAPLKGYHVVTLTKRLRASKGAPSEPASGVKRRLHWRRGHWRHFTTQGGKERYFDSEGNLCSRTWINWQLVGDESLDFVDKHYRL